MAGGGGSESREREEMVESSPVGSSKKVQNYAFWSEQCTKEN